MLSKQPSQKSPEDCLSGGNEQGRFPHGGWGLPDKPTLLRCFHPLADTERNHPAAAESTAAQKAQRGSREEQGPALGPRASHLALASFPEGRWPLCQAGMEEHPHPPAA